MKFNIERLKEVARPASAEELKDAEYRKQNYDWLQKSALIALDIHTYLRKNNISKQEFAKMLDVTPASCRWTWWPFPIMSNTIPYIPPWMPCMLMRSNLITGKSREMQRHH